MTELTAGIDIGTTSVKAVVADAEGRIHARARIPHRLSMPAPDLLEHDPNQAWRRGVRRALKEVAADHDVRAVNVAAMVPSLAAVNRRGVAQTPGLLYGDARGRGDRALDAPGNAGELLGFLRWCAAEVPDAHGYWPAQAVANQALCGRGVLDSVSAMSGFPLYDGTRWDEEMAASAGTDASKLPPVVPGNEAIGDADGVVVGPGIIDAFAEQMVAGADSVGDVLVILGATLITWAVIPEWREEPGLWTIPHSAPGLTLVGGPSNAGGLFVDWAMRIAGRPAKDEVAHPERVPVWAPYVRGERTPYHDSERRAALSGLDLTHGPAALRRSVFEAGGFVVRHHLDLAFPESSPDPRPRRIVATGGGVRAAGWVRALADCTGLPVDVVEVPEGGALGSAFVARVAAGLEESNERAFEWARTSHTVEPDPAWEVACAERYQEFLRLSGPVGS